MIIQDSVIKVIHLISNNKDSQILYNISRLFWLLSATYLLIILQDKLTNCYLRSKQLLNENTIVIIINIITKINYQCIDGLEYCMRLIMIYVHIADLQWHIFMCQIHNDTHSYTRVVYQTHKDTRLYIKLPMIFVHISHLQL